jgi:putative hydrolase of the HAD superfamily
VQCTWFHELAYEPHIPCPILDEFEHANQQEDILKYIDMEKETERHDSEQT